ncbi:type I restriction-modification system S subunit [Kandleria vitulina DSM 20405]|uniref:Type I restriction-modification system S subunit n=1 Tax=Kandleria vitulina DSM 20405 TaxID=1410657 RepID=A0A0R2HMW0_9FIRM|nr:restriction endonuclease subunit S [Kandleria vitulina]KRN51239.1 type I restriction-modification system S subunit [Kandleria vitulina DSM 20405]
MEKIILEDCCEILDSMRVPITSSDREEGPYPYYGANGIQDHVADYIFDDELVLLAEDGGNFGSKKRPIAYRVSGKCWVNNHAHVLKPKEGLDVDYLCYSLMFYNVGGMVNGATRKKLTQAAMRQMLIPKRTLEEQKRIVDLLAKVIAVKEKRQQELEELDNLIKARFVELFGDESNSKNWDVINIEEVADVQVGVVIKPAQYYTDEANGIKAFRSLNIGEGYVKDSDWVYFSEEGHRRNSKSKLKENDILIVRSGAPGTACVVSKEYEGCNAIDIIIAHPDCDRVNPHYLCTYTNMPHGRKQIDEGTGGAAQQHFNVGKYNKMKLMLPPMNKQNEFVDFLKQVDKSKVVVQKALDEAQLLFDSLMQEYFGEGK